MALEAAILNKLNSGVYTLEENRQPDEIAKISEEHGFCFMHIDGMKVSNGVTFLHEAEILLNCHIGTNYDAFLDCMCDLSWMSSCKGYVFLYDHVENFAVVDQYFFNMTVETFQDAVKSWDVSLEGGKAMYILRGGDPQILASLAGVTSI